MITSYTFSLPPDEERLAQTLTRDAWMYFSELISKREVFHIKEIPMMPRHGVFEVTNDAEIIQFYLDHAHEYEAEFALLGWEGERYQTTVAAFIERVESETGLRRGMGVQHHSRTAG